MVNEMPAEREQRGQLENKARLQLALSKISGTVDDFGAKLAQSLDVVRRALDQFGGETGKGLAVSFNGGKDACVVLYLLLFVLAERDELWRVHSSTTGKKVCGLRACLSPAREGERERASVSERGGEEKGVKLDEAVHVMATAAPKRRNIRKKNTCQHQNRNALGETPKTQPPAPFPPLEQ